jgi:hypothetical protein
MPIGELLVESKALTRDKLDEALRLPREAGKKLGQVLVERGFVTEAQVTQSLSYQLSVPWVSLYHIDFTRQLLSRVPRHIAERHCLVPIYIRYVKGVGDTLYVAIEDPTNQEGMAETSKAASLPVRPMIASASDIRSAIRVYYGSIMELEAVDVLGDASAAPLAAPPAAPLAPALVASAAPAAADKNAPNGPERKQEPPPLPKRKPNEPGGGAAALAQVPPPPPSGPALPGGPTGLGLGPFPTPPAFTPLGAPIAAPIAVLPVAPVAARPPSRPPQPAPAGIARAGSSPGFVRAGSSPGFGRAGSSPGIARPGSSPDIARPGSSPDLDDSHVDSPDAAPEVEAREIAVPGKRGPRMVALTLLDGTSLQLPARPRRRSEPAPPLPGGLSEQLTSRDLIAALRAHSHGADVSEILGDDVHWEAMFAALLSVLLKKGIIADWEFIDELRKV